MRTGGGYAVQQALGAEAAAAVRQAASLARRRGDARVNPLHVASAMLSAPAGLLRAACIQSQAYPLQHEALELRLNAALNRLPMAWPTAAMFHHAPAALSNALVAALKRAMARQRSRGSSMDGGLRQSAAAALAVKDYVEIEQLVMSILDDPSVDRAMREAGFSSSQVKANVEKINTASLQQSGSGTTSPNPIYRKARAGAQPSTETGWELLHPVVVDPEISLSYHIRSEDQASQAKPTPGRPDLVGGTEVVTATASLPSWLRRHQDPTLTTSPNPMSTSSSYTQQVTCHQPKFTELTAENLKIMCNALEQRVPHHHKDIVAGIASTVLRCRSGMMRRRSPATSSSSTTSWLLFRGEDVHAKKAMAQELANLVFGSCNEIASITLTANSAMADSVPSSSRKRKRSQNEGNGYDVGIRLLFEAIQENTHRVVWIDGVEKLDHETEIAIKKVIREGRIVGCDGRVVSLEDAIGVLSSEVLLDYTITRHRVKQRSSKQWRRGGEGDRRFSFDLNAHGEDGEDEEDDSADDVGILNVVDGVFSFD